MEKLKSLEKLENALNKLPSLGKKSAERIAYSMLYMSQEELDEFSDAVKNLKRDIKTCPKCGMIFDITSCPICEDTNRNKETLLVVSYPKDVISIERSEGYNGLYHVLNGEISISKGKEPGDLNINSLLNRVKDSQIKEIILATNPTMDGEMTSLYIAKLFENSGIEITRLAYGLQMGGTLDYTDKLTLLKSLEGRRKI